MSGKEVTNPPPGQGPPARRRPLLFSLLCFFAWVYYGLLGILFLLGLIYSEWIRSVIHQYIPDQNWSRGVILLLFLGLFLVHAIAFSGVVLMWNRRPIGYYLFAFPTILITLFHLFRPEISWLSTAVYAILVILFGMFYQNLKKNENIP